MMWLKGCSRCVTGDLYLDEDNVKHCMQCGHVQYPARRTSGALSDLADVLAGGGNGKGLAAAKWLEQVQATAV